MLPRLFILNSILAAMAPVCFAQSPAPAPQPSSAAPSQTAPQTPPVKKDAKPAKKIWTNDDLSSLGAGGISVVGTSGAQKQAAANLKPDPRAGEAAKQLATAYRQQLARLHADLDQVDKKIAELRNFNASNPSPSAGMSMRGYYNATPVADQLKQLEAQKKQIQERIEAIEDDARHKGIPPGDLR